MHVIGLTDNGVTEPRSNLTYLFLYLFALKKIPGKHKNYPKQPSVISGFYLFIFPQSFLLRIFLNSLYIGIQRGNSCRKIKR